MRTSVIINPHAASGRAPAIWQRAVAAVPEFGACERIEANDPEDARAKLDVMLRSGMERVIVVGGDGSIHLAANAILNADRGADTLLGVVPAGTGSDLSRALGLARDPTESLRRIVVGASRRMDVLHLRTDDGRERFVINVASAGISGLVDEEVNASPRRSELAYLRATLRAVRRFNPVDCRILVDDEPWFSGPLLLLAVGNGSTFGRGMRIAPRAVIDDGLAEVIVIPAIGMLRVLLRLPQLYFGTHLKSRHVHYRRARRVRLEANEPLPPFDLDGETFPAGGAQWTVVPNALRIVG